MLLLHICHESLYRFSCINVLYMDAYITIFSHAFLNKRQLTKDSFFTHRQTTSLFLFVSFNSYLESVRCALDLQVRSDGR